MKLHEIGLGAIAKSSPQDGHSPCIQDSKVGMGSHEQLLLFSCRNAARSPQARRLHIYAPVSVLSGIFELLINEIP